MSSEPKSGTELLALPIHNEILCDERIIDGHKVIVLKVEVLQSYWVGEDTIQRATDEHGQRWALCRDDAGVFYRRRTL